MDKAAIATVGSIVFIVGIQYSWLLSLLGAALIAVALLSAGLDLKRLCNVISISLITWFISGAILAVAVNTQTCVRGPAGSSCSTTHPLFQTILAVAAAFCALAVLPVSLTLAIAHKRSEPLPA